MTGRGSNWPPMRKRRIWCQVWYILRPMTPYTVIPLKMISLAKSIGTSPSGIRAAVRDRPSERRERLVQRDGTPDISHTTSAPSPPVSARTVFRTSSCLALIVTCAPIVAASASRLGFTSEAMTFVAPAARCDAYRKAADRPAPNNENGAAGNLCGQHRVERVPHRVHDRPDFGGDGSSIERQHIGRGHRDVLGEGAVAIDADDARVLADVTVAGAALETVTADDVAFGGDEVTRTEPRHAVTNRLDFSGEFVTDDDRRFDAPLCPRIPVGDVQVGPAHPRMADGDQHFAGARRRLGHRLHGQTGRALFLDNCLHGLGSGIRD